MTTTTGSTTPTATLELVPYVFFYGRCEEALEFYKTAIGGTYQLQRVSESPMGAQSGQSGDKVMHATFEAPGLKFMASDGRETKTVDPDEGNVSLALTSTDRTQGDRVFNALAEGGKVGMPLQDVPWGGRFGMVQDRFGVEWLISAP